MARPRRPSNPAPRTAALLLLLLGALGGCAGLPQRTDIARAGPVRSAVEWVQKVDVQGANGPLSAMGKARLLTQGASPARREAFARHLAALELNVPGEPGQEAWQAGNQVKLLIDGPNTLGAMFHAIEGARQSILLESYILEDDEVATRLATLLKEKAAQGVKAAVIYDGIGSLATSNAYFDDLRRAGIPSCAFNPVNPLRRPGYWGINHRDHRKILAVDGRVAFTGGINISRVYASSSLGRSRAEKLIERRRQEAERQAQQQQLQEQQQQQQQQPDGSTPADPRPGDAQQEARADGWRDTQIQIQGPAAQTLDALVRDTWQRQGCEGELPPRVPFAAASAFPNAAAPTPPAPRPFPPTRLPPTPASLLRVLPANPDDAPSRIYVALLAAIEHAHDSVRLTMAYFAPGREMLDALEQAARRGVQVQLILPSISDFSPVLYAGRATYTELLDAGVELHELQDALLHAKTGVIDGVWSTVGSSNMDWRSFVSNNEANVVVLDENVAHDMQQVFDRDLARSQRITPEAWARRGLLERAKEWGAGLFERWF